MAGYTAPPNLKTARVATAYTGAMAITPTDATQIGPYAGLYVGGAGDVALVPVNTTTAVLFKAVPAGTILPVQFQGINATATTATSLIGLG